MAGGEPGAGERVGGGLAAGVAGGQPEPQRQGGQVVHLVGGSEVHPYYSPLLSPGSGPGPQ